MGIEEVEDVGELIFLFLHCNISSSSVLVKSDRYLASSATSLASDSDSI